MVRQHPVAINPLRKFSWIGGSLIAMLSIAIAWWWLQSPATLSEDEYNITIALYRVCNQQNEEGLSSIEQHMQQKARSASLEDACHEALSDIVADARAGNWDSAVQLCRRLLEDQVRR